MPRIKYTMNREEKMQEAVKQKSRDIAGEIGKICGEYRMKDGEFAKETGMTASTFSRRLRNLEDMTLGELIRIKLRFPEEFKINI